MARFDVLGSIRDLRSFAGTFLIRVMTDVTERMKKEGEPHPDIVKVFDLKKEGDTLVADVVVTVNGVEVPFDAFVASMERSMDEMAVARAQVIVKERLRDFSERLYDVEKAIEHAAQEKFPDVDFERWR